MKTQTSCPKFMKPHLYEVKWDFSKEQCDKIWSELQKRETFVDGQIFPYRVEFDSPEQKGYFTPGELNIHHGPLLSAHGVITEVNGHYRGLSYFFGSYVLSFRLIRPTLLEFIREGDSIKLKLHSQVAPWFKPIYDFGLNVFWKFFGITFVFSK
jgi:hypothetical protein